MAVLSGEIPHYVIARGALRHIKANEQQRSEIRFRGALCESDANENRPLYSNAEIVVDTVRRCSADGLQWTQRSWIETRFGDDRRLVSSKCTELQTPLFIVNAPQSTTNSQAWCRLCKYDINSIYNRCIWNIMP